MRSAPMIYWGGYFRVFVSANKKRAADNLSTATFLKKLFTGSNLDRFVRTQLHEIRLKPSSHREWDSERQEYQADVICLMANNIMLWNTLYIAAAVERLKPHGYPVLD